MEGSLRTPCLIRFPGHVPGGRQSNEVVHITDMFTTIVTWAGADVPHDRVIDGLDQRSFLEGTQVHSAREGFPYWMGDTIYGVKWRNFKLAMYIQKTLTEPAVKLPTPRVFNLIVDPSERRPVALPYLHSWAVPHFTRILNDFAESVRREPLIPAGAQLDHVPGRQSDRSVFFASRR